MKNIAFLGLGAMGSRMAAALIKGKYDVTVWNRTETRCADLCSLGAKPAKSPREAVEDADFIFSMVRDDEASNTVWLDPTKGAMAAMKANAVAIECSTLSVNHVRALHDKFKKSSKSFIEAPVAGSRPQAEAGKLIFLAAGEMDHVERARPVLSSMSSAIHYCGEAGAGAAVKLMVNGLFGAQVALMAELIQFVRKEGIDAKHAIEIISATPVASPAASIAASAMLNDQFQPAFPIDLVSKDFNLLSSSAEAVNVDMPVANSVGQVFDKGKSEGFAQSNITGIIQLYQKTTPRI